MKKKIISVIILVLVLVNIPSILLETQSVSISSPASYIMFFLLGILLFLHKNNRYPKELKFIAVFTSIYFFVGGIQSSEPPEEIIILYIKFLLFLFGLYICLKYSNIKSIILILMAGGITIILDSLFFRFNDFIGDGYISEYGRYAGFYLNANLAAFVCILGYILVLARSTKLKPLLLLTFTLLGFLTLSRTFIFTWILINLIYGIYNKKHFLYAPLVAILMSFLVSFSSILKLDGNRFNFLDNLLTEGVINNNVLNHDTRQDQWAKYYGFIFDAPFLGNGYNSFKTGRLVNEEQGVHNSFLMLIGEAGFIPFILCIILFIFLLIKSFKIIKKDILPFLLTSIILIQFLVSHNFFDSGIVIFSLVFLIFTLYQFNNNENYNKIKLHV